MKKLTRPLILASQSPRRQELLGMCDVQFTINVADIDETMDSTNLIEEIQKLAYRKAEAVYKNNQDSIVVGSDTIVCIDNELLGKPKTHENAVKMLKKLSGKVHQVITGVCVLSADNCETFAVVTDVEFFELSDEEIEAYAATKEPLDKAGAYGIQGKGAVLIKRIDGDYYSVMGLPVSMVNRALRKYEA